MAETLVVTGIGILMAVGLVGIIIPLLPGLAVVEGAALLYAFYRGFSFTTWVMLGLITVLFILSLAAKLLLPKRDAQRGGASPRALLLGFVLGVVGFFVIPIIGAIIGAVLGVFLIEFGRHQAWGPAWSATKGIILGFGKSMLLDLAVGLAMVTLWGFWVVFL